MNLRDLPPVMTGGVPIWPPLWICSDRSKKDFTGEAGVLTRVTRHALRGKYFFVYMEHDQTKYTGCLFLMTPLSVSDYFNW
jgi:hypothetical protein